MLFDIVLLASAIRRIHKNNIKFIFVRIVEHVACQRVVVHDFRRIDVVQEHIGNAQHIRELFLLYSIDRISIFLFVFCCLHLLIKGFQPTCKEATRTAGKVSHLFTNFRVDDFCHEVRQSSRCIKLAC